MKAIRRSPVTRATAWLLTSALVAPLALVGSPARAQDQQVLKIVIADTENRAPGASPSLGINTTASLYNEFAGSGLGKFNVVSTTEIRNEAISLGMKVPSNPSAPFNWDSNEWLRVAKSLQADSIVESAVTAAKLGGKSGGVKVEMTVQLKDVAAQIYTNGASGLASESPRPGEPAVTEELLNKGVADAALQAVRSVVSHQLISATVLNINQETVILNSGLRDGIAVGDKVQVLRDAGNGSKYPVGELLVQRAYATDSEALVVKNTGGIRPEDIGRVIYVPKLVLLPFMSVTAFNHSVNSVTDKSQVASHPLGMGAIGGTLAVIAIGVLLTAANRGGQTSVDDLTAEPTSQQASAAVLVRWRNNIFGQGNVQQYKIYREPDFPYNSVGAVSGNGGNGGAGTTTQYVAYPVAVVAGVDSTYTDLPSPNFPYSNGGQILIGDSNGGLGSEGASQGSGGNNTTTGLATIAAPVTLDTGFTPGKTYIYQVTAIILRSVPQSGNTNGGGGTGGTGTGGGTTGGGTGTGGTGNGNGGSSSEYIETDPADSGNCTPVTPVQLSTPTAAAGNVSATAFSPTWLSTSGADVFQVEVSTDRLFKTVSLIYTSGEIVSTAPYTTGTLQTLPAPIDLAVQPQLLASPAFAAFVAQSSGASPSSPLIYWRVGARNDEDSPGPVNWISQNSMDPSRTFRFVYPLAIYFTAAPVPPPPPGTKAAQMLNAQYTSRGLLTPPVGQNASGRSYTGSHILTPQDILTGRVRTRN